MLRKFIGAVLMMSLCAGAASAAAAAEDKDAVKTEGTVKKVDVEKGILTLTLENHLDHDFVVPKDAKLLDSKGNPLEGGDLKSYVGKPTQVVADKEGKVTAVKLVDHTPNPFKGALDLAIWSVVVFLILLAVLGKMAWKPMMEGLDRRETNIRQAAEEAKAAKEEAQKLRSQLQAEMDKAAAQVRDLIDKARKDAERLKEEIEAQGRAQVAAERDRLYREVGIAKDQALQEIYQQGVELASILSTKAIRRSLTPEDHRGLVDEALADLRSSAQERQRVLSSVS